MLRKAFVTEPLQAVGERRITCLGFFVPFFKNWIIAFVMEGIWTVIADYKIHFWNGNTTRTAVVGMKPLNKISDLVSKRNSARETSLLTEPVGELSRVVPGAVPFWRDAALVGLLSRER